MDTEPASTLGQAAGTLLQALIDTAPASLGLVAASTAFLALVFFILGRLGRRGTAKAERVADAVPDDDTTLLEHRAVAEAAHASRREAEEARRIAETDLVTALSRAERAETAANEHNGEQASLRRALREAEAEAAAARADVARLEEERAVVDGDALLTAAARYERGDGALAEACAEAGTFLDRHAQAIATAARLEALAMLGDNAAGMDHAARLIAAGRLHAAGLPPALAEDLAVLQETLDAARRTGSAPVKTPADATAQGLPRLAEILWRAQAEEAVEDEPSRGLALARAAEAALWGGRWSVAAMLADQAGPLLEQADDRAAFLSARLTKAQAGLFAGAPVATEDLSALAGEAAEALGDAAPLTAAARRLAAQAAFEQGDDAAGETLAAELKQSGIDPLTDSGIRAAKARGMLFRGKAREAQGLFEALARQAKAGSRAALGHRLDAIEAGLAAGVKPDDTLEKLSDVAPQVTTVFGTRHPRCGHAALLLATIHAALDEPTRAQAEATRAAAVFDLRLNPEHRWRQATETLLQSLQRDEPAPSLPDLVEDEAPEDAVAEQDQPAPQSA